MRLPSLHEGQRFVAEHPARFKVVSAGRRWGKSKLAATLLLDTALRGGVAWWVVPSYNSASGRSAWRTVRGISRDVPGAQISLVERSVTFPGGGILELRSAEDPDSLRGDGIARAALDECPLMRERVWPECVRPALADKRGDALFISTPKGREWFWKLYQRGTDPEWSDWAAFSYPSGANPHLHPDEIAAMARDLPELVRRQEIEAEFLEDGAGVFRKVLDAVRGDAIDTGLPGHRYVIGVDWARIRDFTVFAVCDTQERRCVRVDRMGGVEYAHQIMRLKEAHRRFPGQIIAERNSMGDPLVEQLRRDGLPVQPWDTTNASKAQAVDALALAFERGEIGIPNDPVLIAELQAYSSERLPGGLIRYNAPNGMHDDTVVALMLAWQGCQRPTDSAIRAAGRPSIEESKWL